MKPYEFKVSDISSPNSEVIYISNDERRRTFGRVYSAVLYIRDKTTPYAIVGSDGEYCTSIELHAMTGHFIPTTALSEKELFILKLSGRLPDWIS